MKLLLDQGTDQGMHNQGTGQGKEDCADVPAEEPLAADVFNPPAARALGGAQVL